MSTQKHSHTTTTADPDLHALIDGLPVFHSWLASKPSHNEFVRKEGAGTQAGNEPKETKNSRGDIVAYAHARMTHKASLPSTAWVYRPRYPQPDVMVKQQFNLWIS